MRTFIFEAVQRAGVPENWGKFLVGVPDMEWSRHPEVGQDKRFSLLSTQGWSAEHAWVCDLATGEGAYFRLGGNARADLEKHRIWVCPLFEEFLGWLYRQNIETLHLLPPVVELPEAMFSIAGYRRLGPHDVSFTLRKGDVFTIEWAGEPRIVICEDITHEGGEGALIRSLTAEETAQLEALIAEEEGEPATTVTFTFPGGSTVTVDPEGKIIPGPDDAMIAAPEDTEALDAAEPETAALPAADLGDTAAIEPPKDKQEKGKPAKED